VVEKNVRPDWVGMAGVWRRRFGEVLGGDGGGRAGPAGKKKKATPGSGPGESPRRCVIAVFYQLDQGQGPGRGVRGGLFFGFLLFYFDLGICHEVNERREAVTAGRTTWSGGVNRGDRVLLLAEQQQAGHRRPRSMMSRLVFVVREQGGARWGPIVAGGRFARGRRALAGRGGKPAGAGSRECVVVGEVGPQEGKSLDVAGAGGRWTSPCRRRVPWRRGQARVWPCIAMFFRASKEFCRGL